MIRRRGEQVALGLMVLALAASPTYVIRPHVGPFPTTVLEILLLLAIAAGLAVLRGRVPWRNPYTWPAILFLGGATIDTLVAPDRQHAAGIWKAYFIEPALAAAVIAGLVRSRNHARLLLGGLAAAGLAVAIPNIAVVGGALMSGHFSVVTPPVAIFNSANAVPLYLVPLDAVAFALVLFTDDRREMALAAAFLGVTGLAVVLSYSRAGWLALGCVALLAGSFHRWRGWLVGATAAVAALAVLLSRSIRQRVLVEFNFRDPNNTINTRLALWKSTLNMLRHQPLVGGGLAGFRRSLQPFQDRSYREEVIYPHNLILNFWSETGLIGLGGFLWLAWQALGSARGGLEGAPWVRTLSIGLLGVLAAFAIHGLVDVPYFKNDQALAFWALLGIQLGAVRAAGSAPPHNAGQ